jgi:hypothetical protein
MTNQPELVEDFAEFLGKYTMADSNTLFYSQLLEEVLYKILISSKTSTQIFSAGYILEVLILCKPTLNMV